MKKIAIIGLGYVGLPLAVAFGEKRDVIGFDINESRISDLKVSKDATQECTPEELRRATYLQFSHKTTDLLDAQIYIVTVPTPVDQARRPDLTPLIKASQAVGQVLMPGDIVVFESTVYPGATEEICVPVLEATSGLTFNIDFFCGYSPERINPGDREHRIANIVKVTSGSTPGIAQEIDDLYNEIIVVGTWKAPSLKVAEAAKVIENAQRDLNIAFMNELSIIFDKLDIDTNDVLLAADTKWNFLNFKPGLVGGHCIGVDPYYLTHKAQELNYHPEIILAGRKLNDSMPDYVANKIVQLLLKSGNQVSAQTRILCLGATFKEDCPDVRNSKALVLYHALTDMGLTIDLHDPIADFEGLEHLNTTALEATKQGQYDCIIITVPHTDFIEMGITNIKKFGTESAVVVDLKSAFSKHESTWRL